jgi:hypothetical protein
VKVLIRAAGIIAGLIPSLGLAPLRAQLSEWPQHSMERPKPRVVDPGPFRPAPPPADAIVLMDGSSLSGWVSSDSGPARWRLVDGGMEVVAGTGGIETARTFGDVQVHVEWTAPVPPKGEGQDRGNSGVFLMRQYEVQVLDSYRNDTYADGQAGSIYGQYPPLVNPIRPPGEWQSYDIVFRRPRFDSRGKVTQQGRMTVFFNGVLVQDAMELVGPTSNRERKPYSAHPDRLPLSLQDHGHPVRFRNIWVRNLEP